VWVVAAVAGAIVFFAVNQGRDIGAHMIDTDDSVPAVPGVRRPGDPRTRRFRDGVAAAWPVVMWNAARRLVG
jgi:hypothetical protein